MKNTLLKWTFLITLSFSINIYAEEPSQEETPLSSGSVLTLDSMAVTAEVVEAKLNGINIKELPLASTVVNQAEIKRLKYVDPDELLDRIPGESLVRNLRIPNGSKSYTIPLIDGAALGSPYGGATQNFGTDISAQDIERIEIFKGPVSALYPNNALGGVINVVSKGSTRLPEQNTRFWAEAGNYDRYRGGASSQGELAGVGYLFDFSSWNLSAYRDQAVIAGKIKEVGEERQQASTKFIFHPDDVSSLILHGSYLNAHVTEPGQLLESAFEDDDEGIGENGSFSDEETFLGSVNYNRDMFSDGHLTTNFNFRYHDESGVSRFGGANDDQDIEMNGKVSYKHDFDFLESNFIFGTDIFYGINDDFNPASSRPGSVDSTDYGTAGVYAGFAQLQFSPIENVQITAGVRHETIQVSNVRNEVGSTKDKNSEEYSVTLPKIAISYDYVDDHRIWFAYGEGFLAPTVSQLFTASRNRSNPDLKPEEAEHFEVGLRGKLPLFGRDLVYDTSYYYQDIENFIVTANLNNRTQNTNAGKVNIQGVETVLEYQPFDFIRLGITHTYASNTYKEFLDANGADLSGEELSRSPEHHINGRIAILPMEGLAIELGVDSTTSYTTIDESGLDPKGRFSRDERINLRLTYDKGPYELWFHALNIGDVKEDRVGLDVERNRRTGLVTSTERSIRTVDGLQLYGGIAYNF